MKNSKKIKNVIILLFGVCLNFDKVVNMLLVDLFENLICMFLNDVFNLCGDLLDLNVLCVCFWFVLVFVILGNLL